MMRNVSRLIGVWSSTWGVNREDFHTTVFIYLVGVKKIIWVVSCSFIYVNIKFCTSSK